MESLPNELILEISKLACTDGGFTGSSLSCTSKRVRTVSRSTRFQTVAIFGTAKQLSSFLSCFKKESGIASDVPHGYRPVVEHLFVAVADGGEDRSDWRCGGDDPEWRARVEQESQKYREDLAALFRLVAGDLQTLCFVQPYGLFRFTDWHFSTAQGPEGFPVLRELHLYGKSPFVCPVNHPGGSFSRLTHLHITSLARDCAKNLDLVEWAGYAPHVTHLCVSQIPWKITLELDDIAANRGPFKRLSHLYVQPQAPPQPGGHCGDPYVAYARFEKNFDTFLAAASLPTKALPHRAYTRNRTGMTIEKGVMEDWLDRVGGGVGCWGPIEPKSADWVPAECRKGRPLC